MKRRLTKLGWVLAGLYFAFSVVGYVGSLGHRDHAWWPMFLYPVIFPCSLLFEEVWKTPLREWLVAGGSGLPSWVTLDRLAGAYYIVVGTLWLGLVGRLVSLASTRLFPLKYDEP